MQTNTSTVAGGGADIRLEELRLALVLNGGISLAVWMGGVSHELNRLVRETHPVYQGMLRLTKTAARIDVISGTSAGGINGAALALAQIHDKSLYSLRDVWLDVGGLENLLHEPDDEDLRSLLRGDDWFLPQIQSAFATLNGTDPAPASQVPVVLNLTSTLLDGATHDRLDDFGASIGDVVHRASWRFERLDDAPPVPAPAPAAGATTTSGDAFTHQQIVARLAFAARSTASFPAAFEPAEYDPKSPLFAGSDVLRIEGRSAGAETSRLLLDGGILDNRPFEAALEGIAKLPANGDTRRVLAYIVPDPGVAADVRKPPAADPKQKQAAASKPGDDPKLPQPTLAQVAWRSLVSIPMSQSIGSHMDQLKRHNADANGRWQRIASLVRHVSSGQLLAQAAVMMPAYRARRIDGLLDYLLDAIEEELLIDAKTDAKIARKQVPDNDTDPVEVTDMRRSTRRWLRSVWQQACLAPAPAPAPTPASPPAAGAGVQAPPPAPAAAAPAPAAPRSIAQILQGRVPDLYAPSKPLVSRDDWPWGLFGLEFLADVTLELLRRTQRLHAFVPRWQEDVDAATRRGNAPPPPTASSTTSAALDPDNLDKNEDWEALDARPSRVGAALRTGATRVGDTTLQPIWQEAYVLAGQVKQRRQDSRLMTQESGANEFKHLIASWRASDKANKTKPEELRQQAVMVMDALLLDANLATYIQHNARDASALCALILRLESPMKAILDRFDAKTNAGGTAKGAGAHAFSTQSRADVQVAVDELRSLHHFFFDPMPGDAADPADRTAWRALALEVFEFTAGTRLDGPDSQAEVVQISARLPSIWGGASEPAKKLNGMQLGHFGAFYRRSWRANDWTFGRLDGIDRAVRIALNPDSLQRRYGARLVEVPAQKGQKDLVEASTYVRDYLRRLAVETAPEDLKQALADAWDDDKILKELRWLDEDATVPPPVLELCAQALTRRLQLEALRAELPELATSLRIEATLGAAPSQDGQSLLQRIPQDSVPSVAAIEEVIKHNLIGSDSIASQAGSDLFTRTASRGLSTAHAALSNNGGLHAIDIVFRITDWPLRVLYLLTNRMLHGARTSAAFLGLCLGVGLALVVAGMIADKLPSVALMLGWALLAGVFAKALLGVPQGRTKLALVAVAAAIMAVVVLLVLLGVLPLAFALACALVAVVALQPLLPSLATGAIVLAIAAWTVHASIEDWETEITSGFVQGVDAASHVKAARCVKDAKPTPTAEEKEACEHHAALVRIESVCWPVLGLIVVLLLAAVARGVDRLGRSWQKAARAAAAAGSPSQAWPRSRVLDWMRRQI